MTPPGAQQPRARPGITRRLAPAGRPPWQIVSCTRCRARSPGNSPAQRLADLLRAPPRRQPGQPRTPAARDRGSACRGRAGRAGGGARACALNGRYCPLPGSRLRRSSRLTVDGLRPSRAAMARTPHPAPRRSAIPTRSSSDKNRSEITCFRVPTTGAPSQPRTAAAGHGTPEPPAFPGLRMHARQPGTPPRYQHPGRSNARTAPASPPAAGLAA